MPAIDEEYKSDPTIAYLDAIGGGRGNQQGAITPLATGIQGASDLLNAILRHRIHAQYQERKEARSAAAREAISSLPEGAGPEDLVRAYAKSGNPDLIADTEGILLKSIMSRKAPTFATMKGYDAQDRPFVTSSTGEVQFLPIERERERQERVNLGDRYSLVGERTGAVTPAEGLEMGVSPSARLSAEVRRSEGAANRATRLQAAGMQAGGMMALGQGLTEAQMGKYRGTQAEAFAKQSATDFIKKTHPTAELATISLGEVAKARDAISKGAYQGKGAALQTEVQSWVKKFFRDKKADPVSASQALGQALDLMGLSQVKSFVGGSGITEKEIALVMSTMGNLDTDPAALDKIFERVEQTAGRAIEKNNKRVDSLSRMGIEDAEEYRVKPLEYTPLGEQSTPLAPDAPLTPEEQAELEAFRRGAR